MQAAEKERVARSLATHHVRVDPDLQRVLWIPTDKEEVVLVEVTPAVPADGEVLPYRFQKDPPDVPCESVVVLMHPEDWSKQESLSWPQSLQGRERVLIYERENDGG